MAASVMTLFRSTAVMMVLLTALQLFLHLSALVCRCSETEQFTDDVHHCCGNEAACDSACQCVLWLGTSCPGHFPLPNETGVVDTKRGDRAENGSEPFAWLPPKRGTVRDESRALRLTPVIAMSSFPVPLTGVVLRI